jgi:two-component system response regulator HydG
MCYLIIKSNVLICAYGFYNNNATHEKEDTHVLPLELNMTDYPKTQHEKIAPLLPLKLNNDKSLNLRNAAKEAEYTAILEVLKAVNFNKTKAAKILNIDRKTLYNKIKFIEVDEGI